MWVSMRVVMAAAMALAAGCDKSGGDEGIVEPTTVTPGPEQAPEDPAAEASAIYSQRCATCHGDSGAGDGPAAAGLDPRPRGFGDPGWQEATSDQHIRDVIVQGGAGVDMSTAMPPNPDLRRRPEVVEALVALIRGFGPAQP